MLNRWLPAALAALLLTGVAPAAAEDPPKEAPKAGAKTATPTDDELKETALKLNSLTSADASNAKVRELAKDKDAAKRLVKVAAQALKDGGEKDPPFKYNAALVLATLSRGVRDWPSAEAFYTFCYENAEKLQSGKRMLESYEWLVEILNEQKKFDKAEELTKRLLDAGGREVEEAQFGIMEKLIMTLAKGGNTDEALAKVDGLTAVLKKKDDLMWVMVKMKADVYQEGGKLDEAIPLYLESIEKLKATKSLKKTAREEEAKRMEYQLTGVYVDNKQVEKAVELLEKLIKADPDRATYYNDLGYVMADNDQKLEESETLIRKALTLDAEDRKKALESGKITEEVAKEENSAYLDSLGWVLYKRGKYEEAYKYLEKASQDPDQGNHIEIWDHVADCLVKLGKKKEAVEVWTKALKLDDASKRDIERRKKVEAKLKTAQSELDK